MTADDFSNQRFLVQICAKFVLIHHVVPIPVLKLKRRHYLSIRGYSCGANLLGVYLIC